MVKRETLHMGLRGKHAAAVQDALGPHTAVFLSDVEADAWKAGAVEELAQQTQVRLGWEVCKMV